MEQTKFNQERIEPKIRVSKDGRWVIITMPGQEQQPIIKSVNYLKAILENAEKKRAQMPPVNVEQIKG